MKTIILTDTAAENLKALCLIGKEYLKDQIHNPAASLITDTCNEIMRQLKEQ